jgi:hypothetical protein
MIKRKDGLWLIYSDDKTYREDGGYFKMYEEAKVAEGLLPPIVAKPVQHLNTSSRKK